MNYQGNIRYKDTWYGVRAEFFVDDPGEAGKLTGHPDSQYPASPPSLFFEDLHIEDEDGLMVNPMGFIDAIEENIIKALGEDDEYEFDIYLN